VSVEDRSRVEDQLRRIDDLVAGLGHGGDPTTRETARELVECVLDLHGLALARIMAIVAAAEGGRAVSEKLAQDEQVKAVLLLYGLHPDDAATRVRQVLERLRPRLEAVAAGAEITRVSAGLVAVRVGGPGADETLRQQIEEAIINAAPDLDEIVVVLERIDAAAAMLAG